MNCSQQLEARERWWYNSSPSPKAWEAGEPVVSVPVWGRGHPAPMSQLSNQVESKFSLPSPFGPTQAWTTLIHEQGRTGSQSLQFAWWEPFAHPSSQVPVKGRPWKQPLPRTEIRPAVITSCIPHQAYRVIPAAEVIALHLARWSSSSSPWTSDLRSALEKNPHSEQFLASFLQPWSFASHQVTASFVLCPDGITYLASVLSELEGWKGLTPQDINSVPFLNGMFSF